MDWAAAMSGFTANFNNDWNTWIWGLIGTGQAAQSYPVGIPAKPMGWITPIVIFILALALVRLIMEMGMHVVSNGHDERITLGDAGSYWASHEDVKDLKKAGWFVKRGKHHEETLAYAGDDGEEIATAKREWWTDETESI